MKFRYLELSLAKIQFCPIFPWKSAFSGRPCLKTSLWRHTLADFLNFGINGKGRPSPILWYHTLILWACQSQVHEGGGNHPPLGRCVTENTLGRRGLKTDLVSSDSFYLTASHLLNLGVDHWGWTKAFHCTCGPNCKRFCNILGPRPVARIDFGGVWDPQKVDLLDPKSGLFEPHPP